MNKQAECSHPTITPTQNLWTCTECALEFAPVTQFEFQMEVALSSMAVVMNKIAKMNGVSDEAVDAQVAAAARRPGFDLAPGDGHAHQYDADITACVLCGHNPFLGGA